MSNHVRTRTGNQQTHPLACPSCGGVVAKIILNRNRNRNKYPIININSNINRNINS